MSQIEIIPAVLVKSREELFSVSKKLQPFATALQLDVVDGVFDDDIAWPYIAPNMLDDISNVRLPHADELFWEADLMVKNPRTLGEQLIGIGVRRIIAHIEAFTDDDAAREAFEVWGHAGARVGVSIRLETPIAAVEGVFYDVEMIQVMGIAEIGAQGHAFDERALVRVRELRNRFPQAIISVDGGVNATNATALVVAGANRLVVGSAILKANDPRAAYEEMVKTVAKI